VPGIFTDELRKDVKNYIGRLMFYDVLKTQKNSLEWNMPIKFIIKQD